MKSSARVKNASSVDINIQKPSSTSNMGESGILAMSLTVDNPDETLNMRSKELK